LTKVHEEVVVGKLAEVTRSLPEPRGEFTLVISDLSAAASEGGVDVEALLAAAQRAGLSPRAIVDILRAAGVPRREAYRRAQADR
jgi:16S rRNA C1402 (ribose-2'-O) methylase RsmI